MRTGRVWARVAANAAPPATTGTATACIHPRMTGRAAHAVSHSTSSTTDSGTRGVARRAMARPYPAIAGGPGDQVVIGGPPAHTGIVPLSASYWRNHAGR